jgi:hypothetical protein
MGRCTNTSNLRILHRVKDSGAESGNIKVYCTECYEMLVGKGKPSENVQDVSADTRERALKRAGDRCECTSAAGCHR